MECYNFAVRECCGVHMRLADAALVVQRLAVVVTGLGHQLQVLLPRPLHLMRFEAYASCCDGSGHRVPADLAVTREVEG
jgi:hypothetical protein